MLVVIAAAKYSEGSKVPLDHIAFTDSAGSEGERWYYDLDMRTARKIHRDIVSGAMKPEQAFAIIVSSWEKISASAELAAN